MRIRLSIKALSLLTVIASTPVSAIVASDNPDNWIAPSLLGLDGVGLLSINSSNGSGSALVRCSGGQYLLTAAHCITDHNTGLKTVTSMSVSFKAALSQPTALSTSFIAATAGSTIPLATALTLQS